MSVDRNSYGMVAQYDTGVAESYACNSDEQSLNVDLDELERRLERFFDEKAPNYKPRIPLIMDAYREHPLLLFGDLDNNYGTDYARPIERDLWDKEDDRQRVVRVQVAQDYIYTCMDEGTFVHPREVSRVYCAKMGTSKAAVAPMTKQQHKRKRGIKGRIAGTKGRMAKRAAARIGRIASEKIRRSVTRVSRSSRSSRSRLSAPTVLKVQ
jgi:hypothetical protein